MAKKILIIDDEQDIRTYLEALFRNNGYETATAEDGQQGLTRAQEFKPDLITLDILMPKRTGIMLYRKLRKDGSLAGTAIVVLTGLAQYRSFYAQDFERTPPPDAFVEKPIDKDAFLEQIAELLGGEADEGES